MSSPEPQAKRARPKPKPRLKAPAPAAALAAPAKGPAPLPTTFDLTSSSPPLVKPNGKSHLPSSSKRQAQPPTNGDDEAPSWVVGSQLLSDDIEIVETSAQARQRQRSQSGTAIDLDDDDDEPEDPAAVAERRRLREEEEERERLAEDEWMAQARRGVRHVPAPISNGKGKGRASPLSSRPTSPSAAADAADVDAASDGGKSDEGEYSARMMRRYKRKKDGKHRWMEQTGAAAVQLSSGSSSGSSDSDPTPQKKKRKEDKKAKEAARLRRNSLTPPPPVADAVMQHAENRVHGAMNAIIDNPLLRGSAAAARAVSDEDDDDIDYFGTAAAAAAPSAASSPPRARWPKFTPPANDAPIELGDSDDDEIQTTFVKGAAGPSVARGSSAASRATQSLTRSPSAQAGGRPGHGRNPLMFGAPDEVKIALKVRSHLDPAKASKGAIDYFERPLVFKVNRWDAIRNLIAKAEKEKGYEPGSLIVTKDDARVYPTTNPETLGFYSAGELVGYRRDVYETHKCKQEADRQQQAFVDAQLTRDVAAAEAAAARGASSSPVASTSALSHVAGLAPQGAGAGPPVGSSSSKPLSPAPPAMDGSDDDGDGGSAPAAASASAAASLKVTLRGKSGAEVKLMVKPSQTIAAMLNHYARKMALDPAAGGRLRAEWDGEELGRELTVGETEIEDGDLLEVVGV